MTQDPPSDQGASEHHANHSQDPVAQRWKQPIEPPRAYPARSELLPPPWTLRVSCALWLVASLPVAILMAVNSVQLNPQAGDSPTIGIVVGIILYFAILSVFPGKMLAGRQWARVGLLVVCAFWTLLWLGELGYGFLFTAPTAERPFTRGFAVLIGFLFSIPIDEPVVSLGVAILVGAIVVIMICASILMFRRTSNEFFGEIRAARRWRRSGLEGARR